eukprot:8283252-Pyramimonas_sp.AAC.1
MAAPTAAPSRGVHVEPTLQQSTPSLGLFLLRFAIIPSSLILCPYYMRWVISCPTANIVTHRVYRN